MNPDFQQCLAKASELVRAHRRQAPEGCDPQAVWAATAISLVGVGVSAYNGYASRKQQQQAMQGADGAFGPLAVAEPAEINYASPQEILAQWRGEVTGNFPEYSKIAASLNEDEQKAAIKANQMQNPNYYGLLGHMSNQANDYLSGKLPGDVQANILNTANENAYLRGFSYGKPGGGADVYAGGNSADANLALKNLGLTSLDLSKLGFDMGTSVLNESRAGRGRVISATDTIPTQVFFADQMNKQAEGAYMNDQNQNNYEAALQNAPQQAAYQQLMFRSNAASNDAAIRAQQANTYAQIAGTLANTYARNASVSGSGSSFAGQYGDGGNRASYTNAVAAGSSAPTAGSWTPTTTTTTYGGPTSF